jgi:sec-independent protein translocase protein TatA
MQPWHWLIVIVAFVLLFGASKLPTMARSLGQSARIFKSEIKGMQSDDEARAKSAEQQRAALPASEAQAQAAPQEAPAAQPQAAQGQASAADGSAGSDTAR